VRELLAGGPIRGLRRVVDLARGPYGLAKDILVIEFHPHYELVVSKLDPKKVSEEERRAQDTSDDLIQGRARTQEKPGLDRPYGDLHERAPIGYKAHTSGHVLYRNEKRPANVISE
jgi:hypothetical protein